MILIVTNDEDITTTEVIKWLIKFKKKFIRVLDDEIFDIKIVNKRILLESHKSSFYVDSIKSIWYRRGRLKFRRKIYKTLNIKKHMDEVQYRLEEYVLYLLESKKYINKQTNANVNKLIVLENAKTVGLEVPEYFLSETTNDVILNDTVVKSITGNVIIDNAFNDSQGIMYTKLVDSKECTSSN